MADLQQTGVEAVVEGLSAFLGNIDTMNNKIGEIGSKGNILTRILDGAGNMLEKFGTSAIHVAEFALGQLLADAIQFVIGKLGELAAATLEAASQFQLMELRLNRLNLNTFLEQVKEGTLDVRDLGSGIVETFEDGSQKIVNYSRLMDVVNQETQEQLRWVQRLAVTTPYDAQDIANVYTLARSYGFASDHAKELTQDITDFAAGMGLGNTEIKRIIVNFGQMAQQGKVTQREMTDLARGAFVPVNDILERMQDNVGMTDAQFKEFRKTGEGVNAFMSAFHDIVKERFQGAAEDMSKTFKGATDNAQDFIKSLVGFGIVTPVLDKIGSGIAGMITSLTQPERWDRLTDAAGRVGDAFSTVLDLFSGAMGLNFDGFADGIVDGLNGIADWIFNHKGDIYDFFVSLKSKVLEIWGALKSGDFGGLLKALGVDESVISKIEDFKDGVMDAFNTIKGWVDENGDTIKEFFGTVGKIIGDVFDNLTGGGKKTGGGGLESFLGGVKDFMKFVIDNQDGITTFVTNLTKLWLILQLIGFVLSIIAIPIMAFIGFLLTIAAVIATVIAVVSFLLSPLGLLALALVGLGIVIAIFGKDAAFYFNYLKEQFMGWLGNVGLGFDYVKQKFAEFWANVILGFEYVKGKLAEWWANVGLGFDYARDKIAEWATGVKERVLDFANTARENISSFISEVVGKFDSMKTKFFDVVGQIITKIKGTNWVQLGVDIIQGVINGISSMVGALIDAVANAMAAAVDAAKNALEAKSPSHVFEALGEGTMEGMAGGIDKMSAMARDSMMKAMAGVVAPAIAMSSAAAGAALTNNNTTNNSYALTVNSQADHEPIIQDYNMLKSLVGA